MIKEAQSLPTTRRGFDVFQVLLDDESAAIRVVFFNRSYLAEMLTPGKRMLVYGAPKLVKGGLALHSPEFDLLREGEEPHRVTGWLPVYEKLGPLTPRRVRNAVREALSGLGELEDVLPESLRASLRLPGYDAALRALHMPPETVTGELLEARRTPAHRRLAFDEFFFLELGLAIRKTLRQAERREGGYTITDALRQKLAKLLPFKLTGAQQRVLKEIGDDLRQAWPMNRLLLGDVGSGKTVVAALGMVVAAENGYQAALMAPTEILAAQHARSMGELLRPAGLGVERLSAGMPQAEQRVVRSRLKSGEARLVVGTHSLISEKVEFQRLGFAVIDEQHRFGVLQRADLARKGEHPDVLVMSATPIPRTLAMVLYGDLDVSVLDEKPPGRKPIRTVIRRAQDRERVMAGLERALSEGRQVYVVRPAVEEGKRELRSAKEGLAEYSERFPNARVALVHGKMPAAERQAALAAFGAGEVDILVATTVIEVGIDVRSASVIVVEDAECFGLAQLHQLRGRVGRGDLRSYCVLIASEEAEASSLERLAVLGETDDGFRVAERDLEIRGPGELAGTAQSGYPSFRVADLVRHQDLLLQARELAFELAAEGDVMASKHPLHREALRRHGARLRLADAP